MAERTNEELCALAAAGDTGAFEILLKKNTALLHKLTRSAWNEISFTEADRSLAYEDLYQTAEVTFWEVVKRYDPDREVLFATFAWEMIKNKLRDLTRQALKDHKRTDDFVRLYEELGDEDGLTAEETIAHPSQPLPDVVFFKRELRRVVRKAVSLLPPRERMFILHRYGFIDGEYMTMAEACRVFSLTETTVKALEEIAFHSIRAEYEKYYKSNIEILISAERFLREDEGIYIPFVPPGVRRNLPFPSTPDDKALAE